MLVTSLLPLVISSLIYPGLSFFHPVTMTQSVLPAEVDRIFNLHWIVLFPAVTLFALAVIRIDVKVSMLISIAIGMILALSVQHYSWMQVLKFVVAGFYLEQETPVQEILLGGGLLAMSKVCIVVAISTAIAGILAGTHSLRLVEAWLKHVRSRSAIFLSTMLIGTATAAFGCTQTIAILLTQQLVQHQYPDRYTLALDLEDTVVVLSPLIPWNIAGLVPATVLLTDWGFIPYAFYLYLIPLLTFARLRFSTLQSL
jgi:NhaC family Na+:H+ antiporter